MLTNVCPALGAAAHVSIPQTHLILQGKCQCSHFRDEKIEAETDQLSDESHSPPTSGKTGIRSWVSPLWFYGIATTQPVVHATLSS